jgi:hypothetical protein
MDKRNQDEQDEPEGQHADDPVDETSNKVMNAPSTDDQRVERMELPTESQQLDVLWPPCFHHHVPELLHLYSICYYPCDLLFLYILIYHVK